MEPLTEKINQLVQDIAASMVTLAIQRTQDLMQNDEDVPCPDRNEIVDSALNVLIDIVPACIDLPPIWTNRYPVRPGESPFEYVMRIKMHQFVVDNPRQAVINICRSYKIN